MKKKDHISYSQIESGRCLLRYKEVYLQEKYNNDSDAKNLGKCVHSILEDYIDYCVKERQDGDYEKMQELIDHWFGQYNISESFYMDLRKSLIRAGERGFEQDNILEYERHSEIDIGRGIKIQYVIDLCRAYALKNGKTLLQIIDHKNTVNILSKTEVEAHEQLKLYKFLACNFIHKNFDYVQVGINHTRYNYIQFGDMEEVASLSTEFELMENWLERQWSRLILSNEYPAERSSTCSEYGGCPKLLDGSCPAWSDKELRTAQKKADTPTIIQLLRGIDVLRSHFLGKLKDNIQSGKFMVVDGKQAGYRVVESYTYNVDKAVKYCHDYGIPLEKVDGFSKTDFERSMRKWFKDEWKDAKASLESLKDWKMSTRFEYK